MTPSDPRAPMNARPFLAAVPLLLAFAGPAVAHDFWVRPSDFHPRVGARSQLALRVGERFVGDAVPLDPRRVERFVCVGPDGEEPLAFAPGADPAATFTPRVAGIHVVGYRSRRSAITLEAAKFEAYLREEGLDAVVAWRAAHGETAAPGREVYSRCAKALLVAGDAGTPRAGADRALGFPLELVPLRDPTTSAPGSPLRLRVLHEGAPLAGALVRATREGAPDGRRGARTDADGRVGLDVDAAGTWLVTCVHMLRAPKDANADWESLWASLTFEVTERAPPAAAPATTAQGRAPPTPAAPGAAPAR